jgi:hypothetical protein
MNLGHSGQTADFAESNITKQIAEKFEILHEREGHEFHSCR